MSVRGGSIFSVFTNYFIPLFLGMLINPPTKTAVEALASTELMSIILQYKFINGPLVLYFYELGLFLILFITIVFQINSADPDLYAAAFSMVVLAYFTFREVNGRIKYRLVTLSK